MVHQMVHLGFPAGRSESPFQTVPPSCRRSLPASICRDQQNCIKRVFCCVEWNLYHLNSSNSIYAWIKTLSCCQPQMNQWFSVIFGKYLWFDPYLIIQPSHACIWFFRHPKKSREIMKSCYSSTRMYLVLADISLLIASYSLWLSPPCSFPVSPATPATCALVIKQQVGHASDQWQGLRGSQRPQGMTRVAPGEHIAPLTKQCNAIEFLRSAQNPEKNAVGTSSRIWSRMFGEFHKWTGHTSGLW